MNSPEQRQSISPKMGPTGAAILLGLVLTLPLLGAINLLHEVIGHTYVPVELIHSTFGLVLMDAILFAEPLALSLPFLLWGMILCVIGYRRADKSGRLPQWWQGGGVGLLFGLPLLLALPWLAESRREVVIGLSIVGLLFVLWGLLYTIGVRFMLVWRGRVTAQQVPLPNLTRRQVLQRGVAAILLFTGLAAGGTTYLHRRRRQRLAAQLRLPGHIPPRLTARIFPAISETSEATASPAFPEMAYARYQPVNHPIGVAFSGGGPRAMSCALGQMRGLRHMALLSHIGAISCVSGGGWFGTIFTYAPLSFSDEALLGPYVPPHSLTLASLQQVSTSLISAPLTQMTDKTLLYNARDILRGISVTDSAFNRFWARLLNQSLLTPFELGDYHRFFSLDQTAVDEICQRNPLLTPALFYTARPDRPYLICSSTHLYPPGPEQVLRHFSFTPLYSGMQQFFPQSGIAQSDLGGGAIESFAFDSHYPLEVVAADLVTVATPEPIFALCDMIGATSAAVGMLLSHYRQPQFMSQFHLWPLASQDLTTQEEGDLYSIVDGSGIDNSGIVPLLHRHYPVILAFINAAIPLGDPGPAAVRGVSSEISRLFGLNPAIESSRDASVSQVFPTKQFAALADGLQAAHAAGRTPIYVDRYELVQPNGFDIAPYPIDDSRNIDDSRDGKVTVIWVYNDLNHQWYEQLPAPVQALLAQTDPTNRFDNFPHFGTVAQNQSEAGAPQVLYYSPEQVNLLSHMWSHNVVVDVAPVVATFVN